MGGSVFKEVETMNVFSIPGWNISEIKNPNGIWELIGQKQKNILKKPKTFSKVLLKTLIMLPLLVFSTLFITNKQPTIKRYFTNFASNIISNETSTTSTESNRFVNKDVVTVYKTTAEEKTKNTQTKNVVGSKGIQPVIVPVVIKDYSGNKPWEAFNIIKTDLKTTDNKKIIDSIFDYLCSFEIDSNANNQSLATAWKTKFGSGKTIAELFSYVVNSGSSLKCHTVKTNTGKYWNEVNISGTPIIYDISNKKVTKDNSNYQDGYKY